MFLFALRRSASQVTPYIVQRLLSVDESLNERADLQQTIQHNETIDDRRDYLMLK